MGTILVAVVATLAPLSGVAHGSAATSTTSVPAAAATATPRQPSASAWGDLSERYVLFLDGIGSTSAGNAYLNTTFGTIKTLLGQNGLRWDHFVNFSYAVAAHPGDYPCAAWDGGCSTTELGGFNAVNLSPVYDQEDTKLHVAEQARALDWLVGQVVKDAQTWGETAQIDLVGFSLGGVIASYWAAHLDDQYTRAYRANVHGIVLIESPVGGIPMAAGALEGCGLDVSCGVISNRLVDRFGGDVLRDLQLPADSPSIINDLQDAARNFRVTAIESTWDWIVSGEPIKICNHTWECLTSSEALVGYGVQRWWTHPAQDRHTDQPLGPDAWQPREAPLPLWPYDHDFFGNWIDHNHGGPPCTTVALPGGCSTRSRCPCRSRR